MPVSVQPERRVWTYADYCRLDDDQRYEVLEGELCMSPSPTELHQRAVANLVGLLSHHVRTGAIGVLRFAPYDVILSPVNVVQPDILYIRQDRLHIIQSHGLESPPDLVVEVLSPGGKTRDDRKQAIYATHGVPYYWFVDPIARTLTTYRLESGAYVQLGQWSGSGEVCSEPFPVLRFPLDELWRM